LTATPARWAALAVLRAVRGGEFVDQALPRELAPLDARDRAWTRELTLGVIRLRGRIDHVLGSFAHRPLDTLDPDILDILRLGAYQLLEMDGVPPWAAVSQSVELARPGHPSATGLVNAVLRAVRRSGGSVEGPSRTADPIGWLSTQGSHPAWLAERWIRRFGIEGASALIDANNSRPPLYLRPVGIKVGTAVERWREVGIACERVEAVPELVMLDEARTVLDALARVPSIAQDPAAALVVRYVAPEEGAIVADVCAAPGGKTIGLASGTGSASPRLVLAADASIQRLGRLLENLERVGPVPVRVHVADARKPAIRNADVVFVDAPCTGTGTFRRHVDGRWRVGPGDLMALMALQSQILDGAATIVAPGGLLVYATCSLEDEENDGRVAAFLERHEDFHLESPDGFDSEFLDDGMLRVLPQAHGFDGAFAARLRRRE